MVMDSKPEFIHVYDTLEAIKLSMEERLENESFKIATGKTATIMALAGAHPKTYKSKPEANIRQAAVQRHKTQPRRHVQSQGLLGFNPKISLEQGLKELLKPKTVL
ncbi:MAG: hypothetical protein QW145_04625 [Candidatus Bathyarchaeia archaeon]